MQVLDLQVGDIATITGFSQGAAPYRQRLLAMGLTPGTPFTVLHMAPLGDPIAILVRGITLSLRKTEATVLTIEKLNN